MVDVRQIRRDLGLTQSQFADELGLHQTTVSRLETGDMAIDKRTQLALAALAARRQPTSTKQDQAA